MNKTKTKFEKFYVVQERNPDYLTWDYCDDGYTFDTIEEAHEQIGEYKHDCKISGATGYIFRIIERLERIVK